MAQSNAVKLSVDGWQEGSESDFAELHQAMQAGMTQKFTANNQDQEAESSSEDEDSTDPGERCHPGKRLLWAAQHNRLDLAKELLARNPKLVHHRDSDGYTPLHRASYSDHAKMAKLLLKRGADITAATSEDLWHPLHSACRWNAASCVEILLAWGADVNAETQGQQTPLHLAAFAGNSRDTLQLLIMHPDLRPQSFNCQQDTPRDIALRNGNCVDLFDLVQPQFTIKKKSRVSNQES